MAVVITILGIWTALSILVGPFIGRAIRIAELRGE